MILKENKSEKTSNSLKTGKMTGQCPLCLDSYDTDDKNFFPCKCGYQVCCFCWHRIRTNENGLCPQCRRKYPDCPATFKPTPPEELARLRNEEKKQMKQKKKDEKEDRKLLTNIRVVQKNLVFVHGLPLGIENDGEEYRRLLQIFKECGHVTKCVVNSKTNYAGSQIPKASVYVTYHKNEDALKAYKSLPLKIKEHDIKTSLGTTKYCSNFIKNMHCQKQDCMYLHEHADPELCFTKEQIHAGDHLDFGDHLYEEMIQSQLKLTLQCKKSKDPVINEQDIQPKQNSAQEKDISSHNSEHSNSPTLINSSPKQSRLQQLFNCNRDSQNHAAESEEFDAQFTHLSYEEHLHKVLGTSKSSVQKSLSEETIVNNSQRTFTNPDFHFQPESREQPPSKMWPDSRNSSAVQSNSIHNHVGQCNSVHNHIGQTKSVHNHIGQSNGVHNHQNTNNVSNDYNVLNGIDSATQILNSLSLNRTEKGTSKSIYPRSKSPEQNDCDLGFDPIAISIDGLADILSNSQVPQKDSNSFRNQLPQQHFNIQINNATRLRAQHIQRQKNPPPGFAVNNIQLNQPQPSPSYDTRNNVLINRMSPVMNNVPNSYTPVRTNFQVPRYQQGGVSVNGNAMLNGYPSQSRNLTIQSNSPQALAMQELLARSVPSPQLLQSPTQNISHTQYARVDQTPSPSYWNINQPQQWMHAESNFHSQNMQEFRPASPIVHRRIQPQMRPVEYNRQVQQATQRFNNPSPFPDNPQYMFPNAQHNQPTTEIHFP